MQSAATVIIGQSDHMLWSLDAETRLGRLAAKAGAGPVKPLADVQADETVFLIRADAVIEERLAKALLAGDDVILIATSRENAARTALAAKATGADAAAAAGAVLVADAVPDIAPDGLVFADARAIGGSYDPVLRKQAVPFAERLGDAPKPLLERLTFGASYKGATDFVTKYVWPWPARQVTRWCAAAGVTPNQVTTVSLILVFLALAGFWQGQWAWAILAAWLMTFLDTVDGKLARCTMNSSKWGEVYDHGIDLIHPPFWWWAWYMGAYGLAEARGPEFIEIFDLALTVIVVGYVVQRIYEGAFLWIFKIEGHIWRPFDFYFRTITARRNPNLFILMISAILGLPEWGLIAVAGWVFLSLLVHFFRFSQAALLKASGGPVRSYLKAG
ncbi:MAG: CDP-alcohol phosphatidyltransferase family protein [Alphaproteobacteria bacterium]